jgi:DNA-binding MarR family transcriptional regulator
MTAHSKDIDPDRLLQLSEEVSRIASSLAQLSVGVGTPPSSSAGSQAAADFDKPVISEEIVKWLIHARRERTRYLRCELFAEPAWDMLLDLLQAEIAHRRVSVSSLSTVSELPATTGLRWINTLVEHAVLIRRPDPHDRRRMFVELAPEMSRALRHYFVDVVQARRPE